MSDINPNCDGGHCVVPFAQVRKFPLGGGANALLCFVCFAAENRYNEEARKRPGAMPDAFPHVNWFTAEKYPTD